MSFFRKFFRSRVQKETQTQQDSGLNPFSQAEEVFQNQRNFQTGTEEIEKLKYQLMVSHILERSERIREKRIKLGIYLIMFVFFIVSSFVLNNLGIFIRSFQLEKAIKEYESKNGVEFFYLINRTKRIGFLGIPIYEYLEVHDVHKLLSELYKIPRDKNLVIVLHSPGGELLAAVQLARILSEWKGMVTVVVPYYAMSAGTLIAISADKIIAGASATFGPIDPQIPLPGNSEKPQYVSAVTLIDAARKYGSKASFKDLVLIESGRKVLKSLEDFVKKEVLKNKPEKTKHFVIKKLLYTDKTHDFPVFANELEEAGFNVRFLENEEDKDLLKIINLLIDSQTISRL
ncbi:MAG: ATP-dependent Clp protease proteolytic subunit [Nitrososphaeria archaeon]